MAILTQVAHLPTPPVFISRKEELNQATSALDHLLSGATVTDCIFYIYGVSGMGKTTLLQKIRREVQERSVPLAYVDFDRDYVNDYYAGEKGKWRIAQLIIRHLADSAGFHLGLEVENEYDPDQAASQLLNFMQTLVEFIRPKPFILFFDTLEDIDLSHFHWLQEKIVEPLVSKYSCLVFLASRTPPTSPQQGLIWPISRRVQAIHLRAFDAQDTLQQLEVLGQSEEALQLRPSVTYYTRGLPGLNYAVAELLRDKTKLRSTEESLENWLLAHLVRNIVFKRLTQTLHAPYNLEKEGLAVASLRQFDSGLLRRLVYKLDLPWSTQYPESNRGSVLTLIQYLKETRLVEVAPDGYGYVVPYDLRQVLDTFLQSQLKAGKDMLHLHVQAIAVQWFREQIELGDYVAITDLIYYLQGRWLDIQNLGPTSSMEAWLASVNPDLPAGISSHDDHVTLLKQELKKALEKLRSSPWAFDLSQKVGNILRKPEFSEIMFYQDKATLDDLIKMCEDFSQTLGD